MIFNILRILRLPLLIIGLGLFFAAERYFDAADYHLILRITGLVLAFIATAIPFFLATAAHRGGLEDEAKSLKLLGLWQAAVALSPLFYLLYHQVLGSEPMPETFIQKLLLAVWLVLLALGLVTGLGLELAFRQYGCGRLAEVKRMKMAGLAWLKVGFVVVAFASFNYAAAKKDRSFDWSYLKTTKPGESTVKMVKNLSEPLEIAVFYPQRSDVKPSVMEYVSAVAKESPNIKVLEFDKELNPTKAEEYKVASNGQIVLRFNDQREKIDVGTKLNQARSSLRKLDSLFQKAFLGLTTSTKVAYFTRGHGEMEWGGGEDPLRTIKGVELLLRSQNYTLKHFGSGEGSLQEVPEDASLVAVMGPTRPFMKEEVAVLKKYVEGGGKLWVFLDDDVVEAADLIKMKDDPLTAYLKQIGLSYEPARLANDSQFVRAARSDVDHWFLFTNIYGSHESVQSLSRNDDRAQVFVFQSGSFEVASDTGGWRVAEAIKTLSSTFDDRNRNFKFDKDKEKRKSYVLAATSEKAIEGKDANDEKSKGKVFAFADASVVSDFLIRNPANQILVLDSARWLAGDSEISGEVASEEDVRIRHSKARELFVFHASIFLVPILVLLIGFFATRKKKVKVS